MGVVAVCAAFVIVVLGACYAGRSIADDPDRSITASVDGVLPHPTFGFLLVDYLGEPTIAPLAVLMLAAGCAALRRRRLAVLALAGPAALTRVSFPAVVSIITAADLGSPAAYTVGVTRPQLYAPIILIWDNLNTHVTASVATGSAP